MCTSLKKTIPIKPMLPISVDIKTQCSFDTTLENILKVRFHNFILWEFEVI